MEFALCSYESSLWRSYHSHPDTMESGQAAGGIKSGAYDAGSSGAAAHMRTCRLLPSHRAEDRAAIIMGCKSFNGRWNISNSIQCGQTQQKEWLHAEIPTRRNNSRHFWFTIGRKFHQKLSNINCSWINSTIYFLVFIRGNNLIMEFIWCSLVQLLSRAKLAEQRLPLSWCRSGRPPHWQTTILPADPRSSPASPYSSAPYTRNLPERHL